MGSGSLRSRKPRPAGRGAVTSVDDLAKWLINFDTREVGSAAVIERTRTRGVLNNGDEISYAFGIGHGTYRGLTTW